MDKRKSDGHKRGGSDGGKATMHIARMNDDRKPKIGEMTETDYKLIFFGGTFFFFFAAKNVSMNSI